jgi:hypothetical protein
MHFVYCSECGTRIIVARKAMPNYNVILDIISPHVCPSEPIPFDGVRVQVPAFIKIPDGKFVRNLYELDPPKGLAHLDEPGDRREKEHVKSSDSASSAPKSVLDTLKMMKETGE